MNNTDFLDSVPAEKKDYLSYEVERLSKPHLMSGSGEYEIFSRQRALISRNIIGELDELSEFSLFFYGFKGAIINFALRLPENIYIPRSFEVRDMSRALNLIRGYRRRFNFERKESIREFGKKDKKRNLESNQELIINNRGAYAKSFQMVIDDIIETHSSKFSKENYYFRISRIKKASYSAPSEILDPTLRKITTGDIIMDRSLWSTTTKGEVAIFRYSSKGQSATSDRKIPETEEEVLFMIENNEYLKSIDISGYKFPKKSEGKTSGEMLIKSNSKFKVIGIQKSERNLDRKIIHLEPVNEDNLKPTDVIKNPFNAEIYDAATVTYSNPNLIPKPIPSHTTSPTPSTSTVPSSPTDSELGAVGGVSDEASGSIFPDVI